MSDDHFEAVLKRFRPGTQIKNSGAGYRIVGIGRSYGEDAIIYSLAGGSSKRVPRSHVNFAFDILHESSTFRRADFNKLRGASSNPCNFAVLGSFLQELAGARKETHGEYVKST